MTERERGGGRNTSLISHGINFKGALAGQRRLITLMSEDLGKKTQLMTPGCLWYSSSYECVCVYLCVCVYEIDFRIFFFLLLLGTPDLILLSIS